MEARLLVGLGNEHWPGCTFKDSSCASARFLASGKEPMEQTRSKHQQRTEDLRELFYKRNTQSIK